MRLTRATKAHSCSQCSSSEKLKVKEADWLQGLWAFGEFYVSG